MKVPANIIVKSQYTQGKEFIYSDTYETYQGYYYEMNSRYFIGRTFDPNAREILKLQSDKVDKLKLNPKLFTFISLLKTKLPNITKISSILPDGRNSTRYFAKKLNYNPILIKEISEDTFNKLQTDPTYQTITLTLSAGDYDPVILDQADKQMPGLKSFLLG